MSNSRPERVASTQLNVTLTGDGREGPLRTSNLARNDPSPESSDDRDMSGKDQTACFDAGFLFVII